MPLLACLARTKHGVSFIDEHDGRVELSCHREECLDDFFILAMTFLPQLRRGRENHVEAGFPSNAFGKKALARARGSPEDRTGDFIPCEYAMAKCLCPCQRHFCDAFEFFDNPFVDKNVAIFRGDTL